MNWYLGMFGGENIGGLSIYTEGNEVKTKSWQINFLQIDHLPISPKLFTIFGIHVDRDDFFNICNILTYQITVEHRLSELMWGFG